MNDYLLLLVNGWAGNNPLVDGVGVFSAVYLIFIVFLVAAACIAHYAYKREWRPIVYFCVSLVMAFIVLRLMALLQLDHRPFMDHALTQLIPHAPGESFPSDHTTSSAAVALGILLFTRFKKIGVGLLVAACVIGFSRIFVGVHYPLDIAGGLVTAFIGVGLVAVAKKIMDTRKLHPVATSGVENK